MTDARLTRLNIEALGEVDPDARLTRLNMEVLGEVDPDARLTRLNMEVLAVELEPPAAPTNPAATTLSASSIRVTWDNVADETGYRVERSPDGAGSWVDVSGNLAADTTSYDDTGLTASTQYFYRVYAFNASGDSDPSSTVNATTDAAPSGGGNRMGGDRAIRRSPVGR